MKNAPKNEKSRTIGFDLKIGRSGFGLTSGHLTKTQFCICIGIGILSGYIIYMLS